MNHHILKQIIKSLVKEQYFIKKTQGTKGIGPKLTLLLEARIDDVKSNIQKWPIISTCFLAKNTRNIFFGSQSN